ncbi:MAG TPA: ATP-binding cassette domain-containing protein, partial [Ottowia sp.]|nr:ATP-binding cassette domain-containing protein [Ottowia sp.]
MEAAVQASDPVDATPAPGEPVIEVRGLWSVFPLPGGGEHVVHQDLDLTVRRGEVLTLVGGSGTGKTVLLRQMLGLNHPARGSVTVLGRPAHELAREGAATRVGMLFQQGALFSAFSVLDNIAFPLRETGALPEALVREAALLKLRMVGLKAGDAHKMPSELSGGMIKRVALARALIMDPP